MVLTFTTLIPNWHDNELGHYIQMLVLMEEKSAFIYIEHGFLEDILLGAMCIAWV